MSNVIRFLEAVGSRPLSAAEYVANVNALDAGFPQKQALLRHDGEALEDLLVARKKVYCAVFAADEDFD
jgi:hypothetical protein